MSDKSNDTLVESNNTLVCDQCGAENWNLASEGKNHGQSANPVKGYDACDGVWRLPRAADRRVAEDIKTILREFAREMDDDEDEE